MLSSSIDHRLTLYALCRTKRECNSISGSVYPLVPLGPLHKLRDYIPYAPIYPEQIFRAVRHRVLLGAMIVVVALIAGSVVAYSSQSALSPYPSPSCAALKITRNSLASSNLIKTYVCGSSEVSDGNQKMTLND